MNQTIKTSKGWGEVTQIVPHTHLDNAYCVEYYLLDNYGNVTTTKLWTTIKGDN